ncbi:hypothetical protein F2Q68_00044307 [Brassica cretica]|uniref:Uncharacterized protein n=1 Tax=Brassica cretica TaxID=69181 RepID=A0A8S9LG55_BRACR|nr:hypothetical protein F2Q68_00044307 [Brassica cretica]
MNFRGNSEDHQFVGKVLGIYRGRTSSGYFDGLSDGPILGSFDEMFLGIFIGEIPTEFRRQRLVQYPRKFFGIFREFHFPSECPSEYRCFLVVLRIAYWIWKFHVPSTIAAPCYDKMLYRLDMRRQVHPFPKLRCWRYRFLIKHHLTVSCPRLSISLDNVFHVLDLLVE